MAAKYPAKYWWIVLIVVPIVAALIGLLPSLLNCGGGGTTRIVNNHYAGNHMYHNVEVVLNLFTAAEGAQPGTEADIRRGFQAIESRDYASAIPLFQKLAKQAPSPELYNILGVLHAQNGDARAARAAYDQAVAADSSYELARLNLALLELKAGNLEAALACLDKAPGLPEARSLARLVRGESMEGDWKRNDGLVIRLTRDGSSYKGHLVHLTPKLESLGFTMGEHVWDLTPLGGGKFRSHVEFRGSDKVPYWNTDGTTTFDGLVIHWRGHTFTRLGRP